MAKPASLAMDWNNENANWLKAGHGLLHLRDLLIPETIRVIQEFHAKITTGVAETACSCTAENLKKSTKKPPCNTCGNLQKKINAVRTEKETQLIWSNTDPTKWRNQWWEVAKCFLGSGQTNNHGPKDTDSANLFTLWINCSEFATLCTSTVLEKVRETRNTLAHEPDMKCSDAKLQDHFNNMLNLVNDPKLCARIGQASVALVAKLKEIRDETFEMVPIEKENVLKDLGKLKCIIPEVKSSRLQQLEIRDEALVAVQSEVVKVRKDVGILIRDEALVAVQTEVAAVLKDVGIGKSIIAKVDQLPASAAGGGTRNKRHSTIVSPDDLAVGNKSSWYELEITGEISNLSPRLWDLDHLTSLYLNKNKLIVLPPEIARLHNLKCLDISDNKLCSLPRQLGNMVHLRELLLNNNNLQHIPFEMWGLDHLTSLYLNKNKLILLPPEISRLHNLKCMDISDNKLCSLPRQLGHMVQLRELLLNNNNLQHLPFQMGKLVNLQTLGLKGNPLPGDIMSIYTQPGGVQKLLTFLRDDLSYDTVERLKAELADTYLQHYSKLQPVPWSNEVSLPLNLVYQEQTVTEKKCASRQHGSSSELKSILELWGEEPSRPGKILVESPAGTGKSTLCQKLIQAWALRVKASVSQSVTTEVANQHQEASQDDLKDSRLHQYHLVFFIRVRDLIDGDLTTNLQENVVNSNWKHEDLKECISENIEQVLLIVDGYDEGNDVQKRCVDGWLKGTDCRGCTLIVTSRPGFCRPTPQPEHNPNRTYREWDPGMRLDQIPQEKFERIVNIVTMAANARMRLREIVILCKYRGEINAEDVVGTLREILNWTARERKPLQLFLNIFEKYGVSDSPLHSYLATQEAGVKDEPMGPLVEEQFDLVETMAEICKDAHVCHSVAAILQCPDEVLHPESSVKQLLHWARDNGQTIATVDELFKNINLQPDVCTFLASKDQTGHSLPIDVQIDTSEGLADDTVPQEVGGFDANIIMKAMHRIISRSSEIPGLTVRRYICHQEELEVFASLDTEKYKNNDRSISNQDALLEQLRNIADEVRIKVNLGALPQLNYSCGQLGLSDMVMAGGMEAHIAGYVSNNHSDLYALTVGHLLENCCNGEDIDCLILDITGKKLTGHILKWKYDSETDVDDEDYTIMLADVALIKLSLCTGWKGSNALVGVSSDRSNIMVYPRLYKNDPVPLDTKIMLALRTPYGNIVTGSVKSRHHAPNGDLIWYVLQPDYGDTLSRKGDSGTLVCSQPLLCNRDYVHAYAYIQGHLKTGGMESVAVPIRQQMGHVVSNADDYELFRTFSAQLISDF